MKTKDNEFDMDSFSNRLKVAIGDTSLRAFAKKSGLGYSTLNSYISGVSQPSISQLLKLVQATGKEIEWLVGIDNEKRPELRIEGLIAISRYDGSNVLYFSHEWLKNKGINETDNLAVIVMPDDGMFPTIKENELIIIEKSDSVGSDGIYAFKRNEKLYVKRIQDRVGKFSLINDNVSYPPVELKNINDIEIMGKVVLV